MTNCLNHLHMENEEDDDVSFAKWMSSFWGHSWIDENERELRNHRERRSQDIRKRRISLPCPTQFTDLPMPNIHGPSTVVPVSGHPRRHSHEDHGFRGHHPMRAGKMCSQNSSLQGQMKPKGRSHSIQEFSEHFEQQLCFRNKRSVSLSHLGPVARYESGRLEMASDVRQSRLSDLSKITQFEPEVRKERKDRESPRSRTRIPQEAGERRGSKEKEQEVHKAALTKESQE
ncbi:leukemia NUP98 fusion partner 1 [Macrotis lagotis]|uniref:leukemia NUP98 fusion partner 1 n=1 Tax=Macrotis lagotis TaxID=92651 RepID=UPI003D684DAC